MIGVDGRPITGLYAAGEITRTFYDLYPLRYVVLRSLTFGRIAGAEVADRERAGPLEGITQ